MRKATKEEQARLNEVLADVFKVLNDHDCNENEAVSICCRVIAQSLVHHMDFPEEYEFVISYKLGTTLHQELHRISEELIREAN